MNRNIFNAQCSSYRVSLRPLPAQRAFTLNCQNSSSVSTDVRAVEGLSKVLQHKHYKAVLLDQFGCVHDGQRPYAGAIDCVREIHAAGIPIWIISNSSRRSTGTVDKMAKMGFRKEWFAGAVTSGELAFQHLQNRPTEWWRTLGRRVLHLTWGARGQISLDGLNLEVVDWPEEAEFILAHGSEAVGSAWGRPVREMSLPKINQLLVRAAAISKINKRPMPMIVANPDLVTVDGDKLVVMPGTLAATYHELGGVVQLMGKPDPVIYKSSLKGLGMENTPAAEVLAIGDSLQHDIAGAAALGIDTLLVAGGIHATELLTDQAINDKGLQTLCEQHHTRPTYVTAALKW